MSPLQTVPRRGTSTRPAPTLDITTGWAAGVASYPVSPTSRPAPTRAPCRHEPRCPAADALDHAAARVVAAHPDQGWSLLCNGVVVFDDSGELLPDGAVIKPHPAAPRRRGLAVCAG